MMTCLTQGLLLACLIGSSSCTSLKPTGPRHRIEYVGPNTYRWGQYQGLSLISFGDRSSPKIATNGSFFQDRVKLVLAEDDETGKSGNILSEHYVPLEGDSVRVDFSTFPQDGRLKVTRRHCGLDYIRDLLETRNDGLEVVDHEPVKLAGDPSPEDVVGFGNAYFEQHQDVDLNLAKHRFFHAGAHYPKLAILFLQRLDNRIEEAQNAVVGAESFNYRQRFELVEELAAELEKE
jgi:hypothetical protein